MITVNRRAFILIGIWNIDGSVCVDIPGAGSIALDFLANGTVQSISLIAGEACAFIFVITVF
ncbi:MAG: hypothetical protein IJ752_03145, partial [Alphaproteobacteria bacterium]|nr:hypothetical protein [Alphaproteobacteria bacterium]